MDKMHKSVNTYVKSLSKRAEGDDREKTLPGGHMGSTMVQHSEDFEPDSEFGNCLAGAYHCKDPNYFADLKQLLDEQTNGWLVCRKPTWPVRHRLGWRAWSAPWPK